MSICESCPTREGCVLVPQDCLRWIRIRLEEELGGVLD